MSLCCFYSEDLRNREMRSRRSIFFIIPRSFFRPASGAVPYLRQAFPSHRLCAFPLFRLCQKLRVETATLVTVANVNRANLMYSVKVG